MTNLIFKPQGLFAAMSGTVVEVRDSVDYPGDLWFGIIQEQSLNSIMFSPRREDAIALARKILSHYKVTA